MGYNKLISYGDFIELYEYEKNIPTRIDKIKKNNESRIRVQDLAYDRATLLRRQTKRYDNVKRSQMVFRRLITANLDKSSNPLFFTFTYSENIEDIRQGYKDFRAFVRCLRSKFGTKFKYITVPEFQKRGAIHFHSLFWGLPSYIFRTERQTRLVAKYWKKGFVFIKNTDGSEKLVFYLSKYMSKAFVDYRLKNQKAYVYSYNCIRPVYNKGFDPSWPVLEDWVGDKSACKEIHFLSKWLGKGRYRLFKVS